MLYPLPTCSLFKGSVPYHYSSGRIKVIRIKCFLNGTQSQQYMWEIASKFNQPSGLLTNSHPYNRKIYTFYTPISSPKYTHTHTYIYVAITHAYVHLLLRSPCGFHRRCVIYFKLLTLPRSAVELSLAVSGLFCSVICEAEKQRI